MILTIEPYSEKISDSKSFNESCPTLDLIVNYSSRIHLRTTNSMYIK